MAWQWIQYDYPVPNNLDKFFIWVSTDINCYFALNETSEEFSSDLDEEAFEESWIYYAGDATHAAVDGLYLTAATDEEEAQTNYLTTAIDVDGRAMYILPTQFWGRTFRIYFDDTAAPLFYEFRPSFKITANEIIAGQLLITDRLMEAPSIKIEASNNEYLLLGSLGSDVYGIRGKDASGNIVFELSDSVQQISGWNITNTSLYKLTDGEPGGTPETGITLETAGGPNGQPVIRSYSNTTLTAAIGNYYTDMYGLYGISGSIGGWLLSNGALFSLTTGAPGGTPNNGITLETAGGANGYPVIRSYAGTTLTAAIGNYADGYQGLYGITGAIGGWFLDVTSLQSFSGTIKLHSESGSEYISVGDPATDGIKIDSSGFSVYDGGIQKGFWGVDSSWWLGTSSSDKKVEWDPDSDTFYVRGNAAFDTIVFQEVLTTKGSLVVSISGGDLYEPCTTASAISGTFTIKVSISASGLPPFSSSDVCKIDNGINSSWFTVGVGTLDPVGSKYYQYTATLRSGATSTTFAAGTGIVDYGQSGDGWHILTVDQSDSPRYSIYTHTGSPWSSNTELMRWGNMHDFLGMGEVYGFGVGDASAYIKYDPVGGLVIKGSITAEIGLIGGWTIDDDSIYNLYTGDPDLDPNTGITLESDGGADGYPVIKVYAGTVLTAAMGNYYTGVHGIYGIAGTIGGWVLYDGGMYDLYSGSPGGTPNTGITLEVAGGADGYPVIKSYSGTTLAAAIGNYYAGAHGLYGAMGTIGNWNIYSTGMYNLVDGAPGGTPDTGITLETTGGPNGHAVIRTYSGTYMTAAIGNYYTDVYGLYGVEGTIGGWILYSNGMYNLVGGTPDGTPNTGITLETAGGPNNHPVINVYSGTTLNAAIGNYASGYYGLYAISGAIGGWFIGATSLQSYSGVITLNSASGNENITVGNIASDGIRISSTGIAAYDGGVQKGAWDVDSAWWLGPSSTDKKLEWEPSTDTFYVRGNAAFDTLTFQEVLATRGSFVVATSGGDLYEPCTTASAISGTFTIKVTKAPGSAAAPFTSGDVCKIDNGINSSWFTVGTATLDPVGSKYYQYTATLRSGATSTTFTTGVSIVDYGASGKGWHLLTTDQTASPRYSVYTHAGSPWATTTELMRWGNMDGFLSMGSVYGFGVGSGTSYIKYDPSGGLVVSGSITITGGSGIGNLTDAGNLATKDSVDWSTEVSGTGKPADNATVGATWGTNLSSIPATLGTPSGSGLFLSSDHMGYYTGGAWTSYIDNSGNMVLGDPSTGAGLSWNQSAQTLTISGSITVDNYPMVPNDGDLVACFKMDEGNGTIIYDNAGNGFTGTVTDTSANTYWELGVSGNCLHLDGSVSNYISITDSTASKFDDMCTAFTISTWFKSDYISTNVIHTANSWAGGIEKTNNWYLGQKGSSIGTPYWSITILIGGVTWRSAECVASFAANEWVHVVGSYDGTTLSIYVNGELEDTTTTSGTLNANNNPIKIGYCGGDYWEGSVDETRFYSRALTAEEVKGLYVSPAGNASAAISAESIKVGYLKSANWGLSAGSQIDLENGTIYLGGSTAPKLSWDGTTLEISGVITIAATSSGIGNFTDAGNLATEDSVDWSTQVSGTGKPANNATVGATWGTNLYSIPATLGTPSSSGLYLSSTYMGFYNSGWKTYIDNSGNMVLGDPSTGAGLSWNQSAQTLTISGTLSVGSYFTMPPDSDLVALFKLDEGTGSYAYDNSGNGYTGTLTNIETTDWEVGISGSCLHFDGVNEYVSITDSTGSTFDSMCSAFTISAWLKSDLASTNSRYTSTSWSGGIDKASNWYLGTKGTGSAARWNLTAFNGTTYYEAACSASFSAGEWIHVVGTFNGTTLTLYVNAELEDTGAFSGTMTANNNPVQIGKCSTGYWDGCIDEVRFYDRALDISEIKALYLNPSGNMPPSISADSISVGVLSSSDGSLAISLEDNEIELNAGADIILNGGTSVLNPAFIRLIDSTVSTLGYTSIRFEDDANSGYYWSLMKTFTNNLHIGPSNAMLAAGSCTLVVGAVVGATSYADEIQLYSSGGMKLFSEGGPVEIQNTTTTGDVLLHLDQNDLDQGFLKFEGAAAADGSKSINDTTGTYTLRGYLKMHVKVDGDATVYTRWLPSYEKTA